MVMTGFAAASTGALPTAGVEQPGAASAGGRTDTGVKIRAKRHAMAGDSVKIRGRVRPGGSRWVTVKAGGKKVKTVRSEKDGAFRVRWHAPSSGIYDVKA